MHTHKKADNENLSLRMRLEVDPRQNDSRKQMFLEVKRLVDS